MNDTNNNDSPEKKKDQVFNYEELLNGFTDSEGEEPAEGDDEIVLSNLLDGIDSSDDKSEISVETDGINLDEISEINLDDISSDGIDIDSIESEPETGDESEQDSEAKKVEIEVDDDESESIDYSAILSELDNGGETESLDAPENNIEPAESFDESAAEEEPSETLINEIALDIDEPETSYASLLGDDSDDEEESAEEPEESAEPAESFDEPATEEEPSETLIEEIALDIDEPETSYASLLGDDSDDEESAEEPEESVEPAESFDEPAADEEPSETLIDEIALDIDEPETSYASLLGEDSDDEESSAEPEESTEPVELPENDIEPETSYTSFINGDSSESSSEDDFSVDELSFDEIDDGTDKEAFDKLTEDEFSLDDLGSDSEDEEEFVLPQDTGEEPATAEIPALEDSEASEEEVENAFIIGGDDEDDDSFLDLDDEVTPKEDDLLSSVTNAQDTAETEVMLEGIEMDAQEQITSVTRAELLIAQGKEKEAVEIYSDVSDKKGVSPWVSKRLEQFNIGEPAQESAPVEEAEAEES